MGEPIRRPRVRVAAIIVEADEILMVQHKKGDESYWMLPGGGVDFGETLTDALRRELQEELCVGTEIGAPCFFNDSIAPDGARHIINFHFYARITTGRPQLGVDERIIDFAFHPIETLSTLGIRPAFGSQLRELLRGESPHPTPYLGPIWND